MQLLNTLYVFLEQSYLHLDNDTLRVETDRETRLRVPLHHIESVVCFGNANVSTPLIHRLGDDGVSLVFLDSNGRFKARVEGAASGNVLLRKAQFARIEDAEFTLNVAMAFVAGKVRNQRQVLLRGCREAKSTQDADHLQKAADELGSCVRSLAEAKSLDSLRGAEGAAARTYFDALNRVVRADLRESFFMDGRSRRPPRDRMNALLSFLYALWMNDCRSACETTGLDGQAGFLHALRPGRPAMALDLMEEFRALADRLALTLINRGQLVSADFCLREGGAVSLGEDARKAVVVAYQEKKREEVRHPLFSEAVPFGLLPLVQARILARHIRGDVPAYMPFLIR